MYLIFLFLPLLCPLTLLQETGSCSQGSLLCCSGANNYCKRGGCYCDEFCHLVPDCCHDYVDTCRPVSGATKLIVQVVVRMWPLANTTLRNQAWIQTMVQHLLDTGFPGLSLSSTVKGAKKRE